MMESDPELLRVNHSAEEFARNDERTGLRAHVNTAESLHAILKRAIMGVWHWISDKHLGRYLSETVFHWNRRDAFENRLAHRFFETHHMGRIHIEFVWLLGSKPRCIGLLLPQVPGSGEGTIGPLARRRNANGRSA